MGRELPNPVTTTDELLVHLIHAVDDLAAQQRGQRRGTAGETVPLREPATPKKAAAKPAAKKTTARRKG